MNSQKNVKFMIILIFCYPSLKFYGFISERRTLLWLCPRSSTFRTFLLTILVEKMILMSSPTLIGLVGLCVSVFFWFFLQIRCVFPFWWSIWRWGKRVCTNFMEKINSAFISILYANFYMSSDFGGFWSSKLAVWSRSFYVIFLGKEQNFLSFLNLSNPLQILWLFNLIWGFSLGYCSWSTFFLADLWHSLLLGNPQQKSINLINSVSTRIHTRKLGSDLRFFSLIFCIWV